jgi:transposase InsO family protein
MARRAGYGTCSWRANHPQTQGKIERWHQTLKNRILLENYYLPGDLEACTGRFVGYYNHQRHHESVTASRESRLT